MGKVQKNRAKKKEAKVQRKDSRKATKREAKRTKRTDRQSARADRQSNRQAAKTSQKEAKYQAKTDIGIARAENGMETPFQTALGTVGSIADAATSFMGGKSETILEQAEEFVQDKMETVKEALGTGEKSQGPSPMILGIIAAAILGLFMMFKKK